MLHVYEGLNLKHSFKARCKNQKQEAVGNVTCWVHSELSWAWEGSRTILLPFPKAFGASWNYFQPKGF